MPALAAGCKVTVEPTRAIADMVKRIRRHKGEGLSDFLASGVVIFRFISCERKEGQVDLWGSRLKQLGAEAMLLPRADAVNTIFSAKEEIIKSQIPRICESCHPSSVRTTKRFLSRRCASAIQNVRSLESIAETQPKLRPV